MLPLPIALADPHVAYALFAVRIDRNRQQQRSLSRFDPVTIDEVFSPVRSDIEDAEHVGERHFVKETEPRQIRRLVS
jgi:hypothetical protein